MWRGSPRASTTRLLTVGNTTQTTPTSTTTNNQAQIICCIYGDPRSYPRRGRNALPLSFAKYSFLPCGKQYFFRTSLPPLPYEPSIPWERRGVENSEGTTTPSNKDPLVPGGFPNRLVLRAMATNYSWKYSFCNATLPRCRRTCCTVSNTGIWHVSM